MGGDFFSNFWKGGDFVNEFGKPWFKAIKIKKNEFKCLLCTT